MTTRTVDDLDGGAFEVEAREPIPATCFTLNLLACIRKWLLLVDHPNAMQASLWARLKRAESYLIARGNRDTPEEVEVYETIWGRFDFGGEG